MAPSKFFIATVLMMIWMSSCKQEALFYGRDYYGKYDVLKLNSNKSYVYYTRSESFVRSFNKGTWNQLGKNLILTNSILSLNDLPLKFDEFEQSEFEDRVVVVRIGPAKQIDWEQNITDVINIDMVVDGKIYGIKNTISLMKLSKDASSIFFRAYAKPNSLNICEVRNDTLRSKLVNCPKSRNNGMSIDLDLNPLYFAQVRLDNDTLQIVNNRKIKWKNNYLLRADD